MKIHLVEPTVATLVCPTGRPVIEYVDTALPDFRLRVFPTGRKVRGPAAPEIIPDRPSES